MLSSVALLAITMAGTLPPTATTLCTAFHSICARSSFVGVSVPEMSSFHSHRSFSHARETSSRSLLFASIPEHGVAGGIPVDIEQMIADENIDGALQELQNLNDSRFEGETSIYHAIIQSLCAGSTEKQRNGQKNHSSAKLIKEGDDKIDVAAGLLKTMRNVTSHAYENVISGYARRGRLPEALKTLEEMEKLFDPAYEKNFKRKEANVHSLNVYQSVLVACAQAKKYDQMMSILTKMRRRGVRPNGQIYSTLLNVVAKEKVPRWKEALSLLSQFQREPGVNPDVIFYTTVMRACVRGRQTKKALEIFRVMKDLGMKLDVYCYTTAMDACAKGKMWKTALNLLDEMKDKGIEPNEVTYGVVVTACGNGGQWEKALELLNQMRGMAMKINTITYNSAISALSKAARSESKQLRRFDNNSNGELKVGSGQKAAFSSDIDVLWSQAIELIDCMKNEGVQRDAFTFSSAISLCGSAGRWQEALDLMEDMRDQNVKPNRVAYTSAITACGKSGQWEAALELFNGMKLDGLQPDIIAYNALIGAGMTANQPDRVFDLWTELCQQSDNNIAPDIVTLTEVIATLDRSFGKANRERVDKVFAQAVEKGIILKEDSLDSMWEFDLSGMSFPVARAACRFIFRRLSETVETDQNFEIQDLSLITGASRMREYVREVLRDELKPPVYCIVPKSEQGTLRVVKKVLKNYFDGQQ